ncbi:hypothetical protein B0I35DRAFT_431636 [Stachybotrys elegans]|uniref:Secreted protein n=1 Tax=Stachybotrys elegans TaxID=80388 RepID=A0A8K0SLS3_9HYPO|nr:hypothetical protein B0I35DRAFT_431636 [Stachybotrys elegans]
MVLVLVVLVRSKVPALLSVCSSSGQPSVDGLLVPPWLLGADCRFGHSQEPDAAKPASKCLQVPSRGVSWPSISRTAPSPSARHHQRRLVSSLLFSSRW